MAIYVYRNDQVEGPFDELVLQQALANKTMGSQELCCREGEENWRPANTLFPPTTPDSSGSLLTAAWVSIQSFFRRLTRLQVIGLSIFAALAVGFLMLMDFVNSVAPIARENYRRSPEGRLAEINQRDAEIDQRSKALMVRFSGLMGAVAQIEENKKRGYYIPSEDTERVMQQYMSFLFETTQLDEEHKKLVAERESLQKQVQR